MQYLVIRFWVAMIEANFYVEIPIILDIEASGFGRGSYPIEIGVALPDGSLHIWLLKPPAQWQHWQPEAEQVHGITREQLAREGLPLDQVATELNRLLVGKTVYSDGWGVDRTWLALMFHEADMLQGFNLDTIYGLLDEAQMDQWEASRESVLEKTGMVPHRAGTDALIIQKTYLYAKGVQI